jgi:3-hydroxyacyl-[acyl-carrier-protein] dehydratase
MEADHLTKQRVLAMVPQQPPFRFIDDILELDEEHIVGVYRFRSDEYFYRGHFPGLPVTPGVILIETMAQTGVVAFGLYLSVIRGKAKKEIDNPVTLFTLAENVEFTGVVGPGEPVMITGRKIYFRGNQLKVAISMARPSGEEVCSGILAGKGVPRAQFSEQLERNSTPIAGDGIVEEAGP